MKKPALQTKCSAGFASSAVQRGKPTSKLLIAAQFNNNNKKRHLDEIR